MRILVYGINYAPELTGIGKYSGEMVEWLSKQGHEVHVIAAPPYYPAWQVGQGYSAIKYQVQGVRHKGEGESNGEVGLEPCALKLAPVVVYRCPLWVPAKPSGVKRLIHLASFALSSFPVMLRHIFWRPHVVLVIEPPLMCAPATLLVSKLCGAKSWLHIQDFEVDAAFDLGILPSGYLRNIVLAFERFLMRSFDRVSTISPNMLARVVEKGVAPSRAVLFPNWVDTEVIHPLAGVSALRAELGIAADRIVALYSGNMGEKQGLEVVLEAAQKLCARGAEYRKEASPTLTLPRGERGREAEPNPTLTIGDGELDGDVLFVMCGDGAARRRLMEGYADLPNVLWLPLQPIEKLNDLLNLADVHLLPQRADAADLVMPSKLTGIMASGRPVIATAHPGTQLAEVVSGCGIVIAPGDTVGFAQALLRLSEEVIYRHSLGVAARTYAEIHMGKKSVLVEFENNLNELVHGQAQSASNRMR